MNKPPLLPTAEAPTLVSALPPAVAAAVESAGAAIDRLAALAARQEADARCPCCGASLALAEELRWDADVRLVETPYGRAVLTASEARIFEAIWSVRPAGLGVERLIARVYAHRFDGGPDDAAGVIRTMLSRMRATLAPLGVYLTSGDGGARTWQILIMTPDEAVARRAASAAKYGSRPRAQQGRTA